MEPIRPLYLDRTIEDKIAENNAIIERDSVEVRPLGNEIGNKKPINPKKGNTLLLGVN